MKKRFAALFLILTLCFLNLSARADWINLTGAETAANIAEIYVLDDHVRLVLEVYVDDLEFFDALVPDEWLKDEQVQRPAMEDRLRQFADSTFQFVTDTGEKLPARLALVEPRLRTDRQSPFAGMINPMTRQRVPEAPADKRVLYAEIDYPFGEQRPKQLTMVPPLDEEGRAQVTIGFLAYHKSVPVIDFRYLGAPATLNLDWEDPWYSKFDNPNLKRHHKSALMSFLYVEPYEVRHEILTRVKDLEEWMDLGLRGDETIEVDELEPLKQRIGEFLLYAEPGAGRWQGAEADSGQDQLRQGQRDGHPAGRKAGAAGDFDGHCRRHHHLHHRGYAAAGRRWTGSCSPIRFSGCRPPPPIRPGRCRPL